MTRSGTLLLLAATMLCVAATGRGEDGISRFFESHCNDCHGGDEPSSELSIFTVLGQADEESWPALERIYRKLLSRQMPPAGSERPEESQYDEVVRLLGARLDQMADSRKPKAPPALRRLTRLEYQNAIRDLLDIEIDAEQMLPADESSGGFDNITVGELSPLLLNRYVSAAQKISRLAVGKITGVAGRTIRIRPDLTQEQRVPGLPLGTRGGAVIKHYFPQTGEYEFTIRLSRDRNEEVEGLRREHSLEVLLDRAPLHEFSVRPPKNKRHSEVDKHLRFRRKVDAGPHDVGITFRKLPQLLEETKRQPYDAHFNMHRHPRLSPAIFQVSITGPFEPTGPGETPSRRKLFADITPSVDDEFARARLILSNLARRAYRRPVRDEDLQRPLAAFRRRRESGDFDDAVQASVATILVSPNFLFRIEASNAANQSQFSDFELATRLSFFIWSSIPDEELLDLAERNQLRQSRVLHQQVKRMIADDRAAALATNFADQWLQLRNLESATPNLRLFPDFDDNLRQSFRRETQLLLLDGLKRDASIVDLIRSNYTFLNERLARHYEIPHVLGPRFRRVELKPEDRRGGVLRHGGVLTVSSYATRTSPVLRGKWILENLLGSPPPPPPDDVPALEENTVDSTLSVRDRLAAHRANPACASCHDLIDPIGFALENYDAVGRFSEYRQGRKIDASGELFDGRRLAGVKDLEDAIVERPDVLATAIAEKLLMFALGRTIEENDAAAVRAIVRHAGEHDYRWSELIAAVVQSRPFRYRGDATRSQAVSTDIRKP